MLYRLCIENIALIEQMDLEFQPGFNVFTGETGAGKSIIIDSVNLVLGERADRELIRSGCDKARVEALFTIDDGALLAQLNELGTETEDELILQRELSASGKNVCKINGHLASLSALKAVSDLLVDIHGQHEHQSLLNPDVQRNYLDSYGGEELSARLAAVRALHGEWKAHRQYMASTISTPEELERRMDILRFQIREIENAKLVEGEEEELSSERDLLQNAEKIASALDESYRILYSGDSAALPAVKDAFSKVESVAAYSSELAGLVEKIGECYYGLEDACLELRGVKDSAAANPYRLEEIIERLEVIKRLKRKYGKTVDDVLAFLRDACQEAAGIDDYRARVAQSEKHMAELESTLYAACLKLSDARKSAAKRLEKVLVGQLGDLGLAKTSFEIEFRDFPPGPSGNEFHSHGLDNVEMMISTNPGEPLRSLSKVVSGGELSRIMLAFKAIAADTDRIPCLIFDEIDSGISGRTATIVGEKIASIAAKRQVICITHSPQIAAIASEHFLIEKNLVAGKFATFSRRLQADERVMEIARILGDDTLSETALEHAKNLLDRGSSAR